MSIIELPFDSRGHSFSRRESESIEVLVFEGAKRILSGWGTCGNCGEFHSEFDLSETEVTAKTACPVPDGVTTVIDLKVPSGKIVVADDLRGVYDWRVGGEDVKEFASYNSALGQHQVIEHMASVGCAYGPVGNSCPGLYCTGDGTYVIANAWTDDDDEIIDPEAKGWERLASICTDLWAYSIADLDDFLSKGGTVNDNVDVVEVPAGTYRFTHRTNEKGFDPWVEGTVIFAHIEYLSE